MCWRLRQFGAYHGIEKPITIGRKRELLREYSDTLLIFRLKGAQAQKYRDTCGRK